MIFAFIVASSASEAKSVDVAHVVFLDDRRRVDPEIGQLLRRRVVELDLRENRRARCEC